MSSKIDNYEEETREAVTLPGNKIYYGISCRQNDDGTNTWYPKTNVTFFSPSDYSIIKNNLPAEELALLKKNLVKEISDTDADDENAPEPSPEWKEALDLKTSIQQAPDKEYLFVASRYFEKRDVVAVAHLSLGAKDTCVAERYPASVSVQRQATIDVCRGKSEYAVRQLLKTVRDFYDSWALFQIQLDKANKNGRDSLSCDYELVLPITKTDDDLSSHLTKKVAEYVPEGVWSRPTAEICRSMGYKTIANVVGHNIKTNETLVRVCMKHYPERKQ